MQLSFKSFLYTAVTAAAIVNASIIGSDTLDTRSPDAIPAGTVCVDSGLRGNCATLSVNSIPSGCIPLPSGFPNLLTSVRLNAGFVCTFYVSPSCDSTQGFIEVTPTGTADFVNTGYNDALTSVNCRST